MTATLTLPATESWRGRYIEHPNPFDELAIIHNGFQSAQTLLQSAQHLLTQPILRLAQDITDCFAAGGKVLVCGNGGSAADAQHFAAELVGRFQTPNRPGLPVLALTTDTAVLTAWANDVGYDKVFARQVEAFGQPDDLLIGISTSGRSPNLIEAFSTAHDYGLRCAALLGKGGGALLTLADTAIIIPSTNAQRIQEMHILTLHLICELVEGQYERQVMGRGVHAAA